MFKQILIFTNLVGQPEFFTPPSLDGVPLPSDADDEDVHPTHVRSRSSEDPPTVTTSLRIGAKAALLTHRARNLYLDEHKSPSYGEVMRLDAELQAVEDEYPMAIPFQGHNFTTDIQPLLKSRTVE